MEAVRDLFVTVSLAPPAFDAIVRVKLTVSSSEGISMLPKDDTADLPLGAERCHDSRLNSVTT